MNPLPEPLHVTVDSLGGLGDGIATLNNKPLFIAKSCPGDRLEVRITHETKEKYQGEIVTLLSPGPARQSAPCPYFDACGGCTLQQLAPPHYHAFKTRMLHSALAQAGYSLPDAQTTFLPAHTRRRVEFKIHRDEHNASLAFHRLRTHDTVAVSACMLLEPQLEALIAPLNAALSQLPEAAHLHAVSLTLADRGIDLILTYKNIAIDSIASLDGLYVTLPLARISVRAPDKAPKIISQRSPVEMQLGEYAVAIPPLAFLQATGEGQALLTAAALNAVAGKKSVVDLFCGIGTYSFPLSKTASIHAVEGEQEMINTMQSAITKYAIEHFTCKRRDLFMHPLSAQELARFDAAIINPPRLGAKAQTQALAQSNINTIAMVSCNPATFARDAAILKKSGFTLISAQAIDQFLWSPHLEIVAVFQR